MIRSIIFIAFLAIQNNVVAQRDYIVSYMKIYTQEFDFNPTINNTTQTVRVIGDFISPTVTFSKYIDSNNILRIGATYHRTGYSISSSGKYIDRKYFQFEANFIGNIYSSHYSSKSVKYLLGLKSRFGSDIVYVNPWPVLTQYPNRRIQDLGINCGIQLNRYLLKKFVGSAEIGLTYWPILYHNLTSDNYKIAKFSLDARFSIGYSLFDFEQKSNSTRIKKNSISIRYYLPYFAFEKGSRSFKNEIGQLYPKFNFDFTYNRELNKHWNLYTAFNYLSIKYSDSDVGSRFRSQAKQGTISMRDFFGIEFGGKRNLLTSQRFQISIPLGLNFRYGTEYFIAENEFEVNGQYDLRDIGLRLGSTLNYQITDNLAIETDFSLVQYFFVYSRNFSTPANRNQLWPDADGSGSTIFKLGLGLNYKF